MLIGLTGGIASGKSLVAGFLRQMGVPVVDADRLAREVVEPGTPGFDAVVEEFGRGIVGPDGRLDRKRLGALVFADPGVRRRLEAIVHPRVRERMAGEVARLRDERGRDALIVLDIPLLFETGARARYGLDGVIVVWVDRGTQVERMTRRDGLTSDDAARRLAAQIPLDEKRSLADWVIDNSGPPARTRSQVRALLESLRRRGT